MAEKQVVTLAARKKMLRARAGEIKLPKIVGLVFGDGGVDANGNATMPSENATGLTHEILRKPYKTYSMLSDTTCRYEVELDENELGGMDISELGLYDADGDVLNVRHFSRKGKDDDMSMTFWMDDAF